MKNIFKISILSLLLVSTAACTDDSKVLPIPPAGASVTFVPESKVIDFTVKNQLQKLAKHLDTVLEI